MQTDPTCKYIYENKTPNATNVDWAGTANAGRASGSNAGGRAVQCVSLFLSGSIVYHL